VLKPDKIKVLIVEDDLEQRQALADYLRLFQFTVQLASGVDEGLQLLEKEEFHIVFTDMRMPQLSGMVLIQKIRSVHPEHPKILVLSGFMDVEIADIFAAGADGFFAKPFSAAAVRSAIQLALLNRTERWALQIPPAPSNVTTHPLVKRFRALSDKNAVSFGRLGFFLHQSGCDFFPEDRLEFDFTFDEKEPLERLRGVGVVRWCGNSGAGIEILQIDAAQSVPFVRWLEREAQLASIPKA
jgi:DNA-binding response OmpR family regulator